MRQGTDKEHTRPNRENAETITMIHAFDSGGNHNMKISFCVALYLVLALIWMPGFTLANRVYDVAKEDKIIRGGVLRPPPEKPIRETTLRQPQERTVPIPEKEKKEPTPEILTEQPPTPEVVATSPWEIGIPSEAPVTRNEPVIYGTQGLESPVFIKKVMPKYPERAIRIGLQGYVMVSAILRQDGTVDDIEIVRGLGKGRFGFEEKATEAVKQWEFLPGKLKGNPVDVRMNLKIDFMLNR